MVPYCYLLVLAVPIYTLVHLLCYWHILVKFRQLNDHLPGKELFIRFTARAFRKLMSIYVFSSFPFGFEGRIWDLIVSVPDHCLSFYFCFFACAVLLMIQTTVFVYISCLMPWARWGIRLHRSLIFVFSSSFNKFPFGFAYPLKIVFRSWCYCWLYQSFINIVPPSTTKHWYLSELNLQIPRVHDMSHLMTKPTKWLCAKRRLRSAWTSTQSGQSLRCPHEERWVLS